MSLGIMVSKGIGVSTNNGKGYLSEVNTFDPIFITRQDMNGDKEAVYHVNLVYLLDNVFTKNNLNYLSIEQERYMKAFFDEADKATKALNELEENPYKDMTKAMLQLDNFLGNYLGENDGRFSR